MPLFPRFVPHSQQASSSRASTPADLYTLLSQLAAEQANPSSYHHQSPNHSSPAHATHRQHHTHARAFTPSFDIIETKDAYVLEGELPGLNDKRAVDIEFTDHQTLLVKGKIEKSSTASAAPFQAKQQTPPVEEHHEEPLRPKSPPGPTVEDIIDEDDDGKSTILTPASTVVGQGQQEKKPGQPKNEQTRYWVSERTIGSFQRTFSFPGLINQEKVTAKLENGVLTIVVPKMQKLPSRRIQVQ